MEESVNISFIYVTSGAALFSGINFLTRFMIPHHLHDVAGRSWKWRNILTSFFHAFLTGLGAPICFWAEPKLTEDMIHGYSVISHCLVSISIGYFIYDALDMFIFAWRRPSTIELLIHHFFVILCFGIAAFSKIYVAYALIGLLVEINSVFLHARQLLIMAGSPKHGNIYRCVASVNLITFVLFRILLFGWMTRWITLHRDDVPFLVFTAGSLGLATIVTMNIINLYHILTKDFLNSAFVKPRASTNTVCRRGSIERPSPETSYSRSSVRGFEKTAVSFLFNGANDSTSDETH